MDSWIASGFFRYSVFLLNGILFVSSEGKKTVFLAHSTLLLFQQREYLARHLDLRCRSFSGTDGVGEWSAEKFKNEIAQNDVIL